MITSVNWEEDLTDGFEKKNTEVEEALLNMTFFFFSHILFCLGLFGQYYHFLRNFKEINNLMHNPNICMDPR
jgi:hypothetical protein